jgi:hypothetical protein
MAMKGGSSQMTVPDAVAMIHATPPGSRSEFAREIWPAGGNTAQTGSARGGAVLKTVLSSLPKSSILAQPRSI